MAPRVKQDPKADEAALDAVIVVRTFDEGGVPDVNIQANGDVRLTEVKTILELALGKLG